MTASDENATQDVAVIDVGSNSVRLVLYRLEGRAIWQVYNEKVLAGLGRNLAETGRLAPDGVLAGMAARRRFRAVLDGAGPAQVFCAATAAVREARDGRVFVDRVRAETGLAIRVLSGEEEAHYSALGVIAGQPKAEGVVGDLGGSSLELVRIVDGRPESGITLPLGPFALGAPGPLDPLALGRTIRARLARAAPVYSAACLHAVGGAWRNIALIHMDATRYPLRIVHQYEMTGREALDAARFVAQQSRASLERMPGVTKKRAETLPYAALVLEAMVETLGFERVSFSAFGLREGLLLDAMPADVRGRDPLVEGCAAIGVRQGAPGHLGRELEAWLEPMWATLPPRPPRRPGLRSGPARAHAWSDPRGAGLSGRRRVRPLHRRAARERVAGAAAVAGAGAAGPGPGRRDAAGMRPLRPQREPAVPVAPGAGRQGSAAQRGQGCTGPDAWRADQEAFGRLSRRAPGRAPYRGGMTPLEAVRWGGRSRRRGRPGCHNMRMAGATAAAVKARRQAQVGRGAGLVELVLGQAAHL